MSPLIAPPRALPPASRASRFRLLILPLLLASLLLSGCITMHVDYDFAADGSVLRTVVAAFDTDLLELAQSGDGSTPEDPFAELRNATDLPPGTIVQDYEDPAGRRRGVELIMPFGTVDELREYSHSGTYPESDQFSIERNGNTTTFRTILKAETSSSDEAATPEGRRQADAIMRALRFDFSYRVRVPGQVTDWGPQAGGTLTTLPTGGAEVIWATEGFIGATELWVTWQE